MTYDPANPWSPYGGYDDTGNWYPPVFPGGGGPPTTPGSSGGVVYELVCHLDKVWIPPVPYDPGEPAIPYSPADIIHKERHGWNSWSRSKEPIVKGQAYTFHCDKPQGACLALGPVHFLGRNVSAFSHAFMLDPSGIKIYEDNTEVDNLKVFFNASTVLRLYYQEDGTIVYTIHTGNETLVFTSTNPNTFDDSATYVYGYLFSSEDRLLSSSFIDSSVQYGSV